MGWSVDAFSRAVQRYPDGTVVAFRTSWKGFPITHYGVLVSRLGSATRFVISNSKHHSGTIEEPGHAVAARSSRVWISNRFQRRVPLDEVVVRARRDLRQQRRWKPTDNCEHAVSRWTGNHATSPQLVARVLVGLGLVGLGVVALRA